MKPSVLQTLLVAKAIFRETKYLVNSGDKQASTAGLILLQDFVELVVLAVFDELDTDDERNLENKSLPELLGELKKQGIKVIKSGTIKSLNKQRAICKHGGQLAEPAAVINYYNVAVSFVDDLLKQVVKATLQEILLTDILKPGPEKDAINTSLALSDSENYLCALIELRKAFYLNYEHEYSIYGWRLQDKNTPAGLRQSGIMGGLKADPDKRNSQWIDSHVKRPVDYVQINHEQMKIDCIEWGVSTVEIENFRRLTPEVVSTEAGTWHFDYESSFVANETTKENYKYCLDLLLDFLIKKQEFDSSKKWPKNEKVIPAPPIYIGKPLYEKPDKTSSILQYIPKDCFYIVYRNVTGFKHTENYLYVYLYQVAADTGVQINHQWGYLLIE